MAPLFVGMELLYSSPCLVIAFSLYLFLPTDLQDFPVLLCSLPPIISGVGADILSLL
jgi:hypothetical protein